MTGSSFYLWVLDCYQGLVKLVDFIIQEESLLYFYVHITILDIYQAQKNVGGGGCDDPDCDCGGEGDGHGGGVAVSG